jgi:hypothetical protein
MSNQSQERRRQDAERDVPDRTGEGGGQMGRQKATGGETRESRETRTHVTPNRDVKPDQPGDDGGRVPRDGR